MVLGTMKMPLPITVPTTIATALHRPRSRLSENSDAIIGSLYSTTKFRVALPKRIYSEVETACLRARLPRNYYSGFRTNTLSIHRLTVLHLQFASFRASSARQTIPRPELHPVPEV